MQQKFAALCLNCFLPHVYYSYACASKQLQLHTSRKSRHECLLDVQYFISLYWAPNSGFLFRTLSTLEFLIGMSENLYTSILNAWPIHVILSFSYIGLHYQCGLAFRVPGYRPRGPGFDSRRQHILLETVGLQRGPLSLVSINEELLESKSSSSGI
jgi:hypothetical protein